MTIDLSQLGSVLAAVGGLTGLAGIWYKLVKLRTESANSRTKLEQHLDEELGRLTTHIRDCEAKSQGLVAEVARLKEQNTAQGSLIDYLRGSVDTLMAAKFGMRPVPDAPPRTEAHG